MTGIVGHAAPISGLVASNNAAVRCLRTHETRNEKLLRRINTRVVAAASKLLATGHDSQLAEVVYLL